MNGRRLVIDSQPFSNLEFFNLRTTYKTTPIHKLETFTFADVDFAYKQFLRQEGVSECVILQTCNRVEIYLVMENYRDNNILNLWFDIAKIPSESIKYIEINQGKKVISHLLRLASGLESLVIGENQILGQIKRAYEYAKRYNYCNSSLALAFDRAIKTGTRIRNQTGLSKGSVSVGSMAVNLAEEYFEDLNAKKILVIGTGEAASLIAKSLRRRNVEFLVASRTCTKEQKPLQLQLEVYLLNSRKQCYLLTKLMLYLFQQLHLTILLPMIGYQNACRKELQSLE